MNSSCDHSVLKSPNRIHQRIPSGSGILNDILTLPLPVSWCPTLLKPPVFYFPMFFPILVVWMNVRHSTPCAIRIDSLLTEITKSGVERVCKLCFFPVSELKFLGNQKRKSDIPLHAFPAGLFSYHSVSR